jgi:hypothetical protein
LDAFGPLFCAELRRWRGAAVDGVADRHEELLLSRWRAQAEQACRLVRQVLERVGRIGGDVHGRASARPLDLAAEGQLDVAVQDREHLLKIVTMRRRAAAGRHQHVDQAVAAAGLLAAHEDRVGAARHRDMAQLRIVGIGHREFPVRVIRRDRCCGLGGRAGHRMFPLVEWHQPGSSSNVLAGQWFRPTTLIQIIPNRARPDILLGLSVRDDQDRDRAKNW